MADDEDVRIRQRVLHIICDGSPARLEDKVYEALQKFNYDRDSDIRRTTHKVMATYERTGKWNILWSKRLMIEISTPLISRTNKEIKVLKNTQEISFF